ncbi:MAG: YdcF family protein [bacterium]|nr:YdcF family protein [bacterium]
MFLLLKLFKPFVLPPTLIAIGFIAALVFVVRHRRRWGIAILACTLGVYYLLAIEPIAAMLAWTLERPYGASATASVERVDAIVVLGGGARAEPMPELGGSSFRRLWRAIAYYDDLGGQVPIVYSGGSGDPFARDAVEADIARRIVVRAGVEQTQIFLEKGSRTTYENGVATRALLAERLPHVPQPRIALVTSAWHLRRATGVFTKLGMDVVLVPADFMSGAFSLDPLSFFPSAAAFADSVTSIHEWVGIVGYRMQGRL